MVTKASNCKSCQSDNWNKFDAEINIHFPGYEGLTKPTVLVFPEICVCLDCGFAEFCVQEPELSRLAEGAST